VPSSSASKVVVPVNQLIGVELVHERDRREHHLVERATY
jgi:hypothetical protein